jgi:diaminohydroxyphosphoribosylaminopyrimidine deaminase/5-amino-6-(5-phosphoribosylamino)uracil reductase
MEDPDPRVSGKGLERLQARGIETRVGLLEGQARDLNPGFVLRNTAGRPFVRIKLAASLDGRTAMASGESRWITGEAARRDVHRLRAASSAVLTGLGTVLADDPSLTVRLSAEELGIDGPVRQPLRVILDTRLRLPRRLRMLGLPGETVVLTASADPVRSDQLRRGGARVVTVDGTPLKVNLGAALKALAGEGVSEVLVEAGARLSGALLAEGLVDEVVVYMAPHVMGDGAKGLFHLPGVRAMKQRLQMHIRDVRAVGEDWRITAVPVHPRP